MTETGSSVATRSPAIAGPTNMEPPPKDSLSPMSLEESIPEALEIEGIIASRAVIPGTSPKELRIAIAMNHPRLSPTVISTIGNISSATAEMTSDKTAAVRRLILSMSEPMRIPARAEGTAAAMATAPAPSGLPVVNNTSSGSATAVMELPSIDVPYEDR